MATKDTGGQKHSSRRDEEVEETEASAETVERNEELDEIDDVLESNAEDFVRQFVQKGGQ